MNIYLIWSNEHTAWWAPNHSGYTKMVDKAGRYTRAEALGVCNRAIAGSRRGIPNELPVRLDDLMDFVAGNLGNVGE